jgi:CubicO group peptidase (beta-lactamase class C family)
MADAQAHVQGLLDELTASGAETGLQVAAYLDGKLIVDAWSGIADRAGGRPMDGDSLMVVFSVTKGIAATAFHIMAEKHGIEYDTPVARYWPEFGVKGKERATVRDALCHRAGVPQMPDGLTPEDICDWDLMCSRIADLEPLWEPGTQTGYHAYTWGWLIGEIARRVDGRPFARIVAEEVCRPLGIDSLFLGIPDEVEPRVATLEDEEWVASQKALPADALLLRAIPLPLTPSHAIHDRADVRRASIPAGGGIMNARAIARHYAALACGELDGVRLLTPERQRQATTMQTNDIDLALGAPLRKSLGYFLGGTLSPMGDRMSAFGHPGVGGAIGFADPEHRFAFGLTKNRLTVNMPGEGTTSRVARELRACLGIPE